MHTLALGCEVGSSKIARKLDGAIALFVFFDLCRMRYIAVVVDEGVRMAVSPDQRSSHSQSAWTSQCLPTKEALPRIFHDREEPGKVDNLPIWISAIDDA